MSQTTMILVSKTHIQTVKRLYKIIFQLHKSLPPELKAVGDGYVRSEFKLHKNASPEHVKTFMLEWSNYAKLLMKQMNPKFGIKIGANMSEEDFNGFSDAQITQLYELFLETTRQNRINEQTK